MNGFRFAEMNLRHSGNARNTTDLVNRALQMGYDTVVINVDVQDPFCDRVTQTLQLDESDENPVPRKKKKKGAQNPASAVTAPEAEVQVLPDPFRVDEASLNQPALARLRTDGRRFRQFTRLTATLTGSTSFYRLITHPKAKAYDLLAVRITDVDMLTTLSRKGEGVDIITFDAASTSEAQWLFSRKLVQAIIGTGIAVELAYGGALQAREARQNFLTNAKLLMNATGRGKNVFLSSGASSVISMRAPYDVANLSTLFGYAQHFGTRTVGSVPKDVLLRSQARRLTIKSAISVSDPGHVPSRNDDPPAALAKLLQIEEFRKQMTIRDPAAVDGGGGAVAMDVSS